VLPLQAPVVAATDDQEVAGRVRTWLERRAMISMVDLEVVGGTADVAAVAGAIEGGGSGSAPGCAVPVGLAGVSGLPFGPPAG
jgi:hypothetical protein